MSCQIFDSLSYREATLSLQKENSASEFIVMPYLHVYDGRLHRSIAANIQTLRAANTSSLHPSITHGNGMMMHTPSCDRVEVLKRKSLGRIQATFRFYRNPGRYSLFKITPGQS
jgi:hypothetical protein